MLVNLKDILKIAEEKKIAIGAFNTPGLDSLVAIIEAAEELDLPVIIQFAQCHEPWMPLDIIGPAMVAQAKKAKVPVCVHLDHGEDLEYLSNALAMGFTSIMYDGSVLPYEENLANTKKAVETLEEMLKSKGCQRVVVCDLAREDMAEAVEDAFRHGKLVLATTTYNGDIFPFMRQFIDNLIERNYKNRTIGLIENGSWAPVAAKIMKNMFEKSKEITWLDTTVTIKSAMNAANEAQIAAMAEELMK